ncbi:hypothetical protein [Paraburkholderia dilworthii]|uniref:hypothetical protein n=1 Tax=Paraburkholderia dilworthii TaxID=948106 RepID=UPI000485F849|nr:hypothetical protein [Paraburkholderia dilworthii]
MRIAAWFKNLRKESPVFLSTEFYEQEMKRSFNQDEKSKMLYLEMISENAKEDIQKMRYVVASALAERKTCTDADLSRQLYMFMEAHAAALHQKWLGDSANSSTTAVVARNFEEERAKLWFLMFESIDMSTDDAVQMVEEYIAKFSKEEK